MSTQTMKSKEQLLSNLCKQLDILAPKCAWEKPSPTYKEILYREEYRKILDKTGKLEVELGL